MQALVILIVVGWLLTASWTTLVTFLVIVLIVVAAGCYIVLRLRGDIGSPIGNKRTAIDSNYVAALEEIIAGAETEVETLRAEVARLQAEAKAKRVNDDIKDEANLHRRVGLSESAPDWLVTAARRAYRSALHPDRHPTGVKQEAERRYKAAEIVFDAIAASRG